MELEKVEFRLIGDFLIEVIKEFGRRDKELVKVAKFKRVEQEERMMEEFVQEFRRVARKSGYKRRVLVEKFKREMNKVIRKKFIDIERLPKSIE